MKGDDTSTPDYEKRGMKPWSYMTKKSGKTAQMPYWQISDEALDDLDEMAELTRLAVETSIRAKSAKQ